jgi:RimJ/RimL family protein N-acetyltransferase
MDRLRQSSKPIADYDLGYALQPAHRGHGYAREALTALFAFCLHDLAVSSV